MHLTPEDEFRSLEDELNQAGVQTLDTAVVVEEVQLPTPVPEPPAPMPMPEPEPGKSNWRGNLASRMPKLRRKSSQPPPAPVATEPQPMPMPGAMPRQDVSQPVRPLQHPVTRIEEIEDADPFSEIQIAEIFAACFARIPNPILRVIASACVGYTAIAIIPANGFPITQVILISTQVVALYSVDRVRFFTAYASRDFMSFDIPLITVAHYSFVVALAFASGNKPIASGIATLTAYLLAYYFVLTQSKQVGARYKCLKAMAAVDCAIGILFSAPFQ